VSLFADSPFNDIRLTLRSVYCWNLFVIACDLYPVMGHNVIFPNVIEHSAVVFFAFLQAAQCDVCVKLQIPCLVVEHRSEFYDF